MKTSHQLARELLALPDIGVAHFDPSLVVFETGDKDDGNVAFSDPLLVINNPCDGEDWKPFISIHGMNEDMEEDITASFNND